jgi:hypothetical protein
MNAAFEFIQANPGLSMAQIKERIPDAAKQVRELLKAGVVEKKIYCYGSGGFDGLGFRTRAWTYVYQLKQHST